MAAAGGVRITKKLVDAADPARGRHWLWDSELKGFGVQVEASGTRTYLVRYRPRDTGRAGPRRFVKFGRHGDLTAEQARAAAKVILGAVAQGEDPADRRQVTRTEHARLRQAPTFAELCDRVLDEHVGAKRKARTAVGYSILLRKHAVPILGAKKAEAMTRADLARLHLAMRATPHKANRLVAVIGSMYSFAGKAELVPADLNPSRGIERYREDGRERSFGRSGCAVGSACRQIGSSSPAHGSRLSALAEPNGSRLFGSMRRTRQTGQLQAVAGPLQ